MKEVRSTDKSEPRSPKPGRLPLASKSEVGAAIAWLLRFLGLRWT